MTKQQKTYFLLIAVCLVWGLIGYQFYKQSNPNTATSLARTSPQVYVPSEFKKREIYTVKADYRDPFLGNLYSQKRKPKKTKQKPKKENTIPFPNVVYNGIVEGGSSTSYTITINGKQQLFKLGETLNELTLLRANDTEITVRFNDISKKIKLK